MDEEAKVLSTRQIGFELKAGDKVLLLRVQRGQKFVVLSRVYEGGD